MNFGKNLQYLRRLCKNLTQEELAEKLNVSRQTVSKWETNEALPEMEKALELCRIFNCSLDNLFREQMIDADKLYSNLRFEKVKAFRYVMHTVISTDPESDALDRIYKYAKDFEIENPEVIGWDFPFLSQEQINVYHMHGYTAALILPEGFEIKNSNLKVYQQEEHNYAAIHIERPFEDPFSTIPGAYRTLDDFMKVNGREHEDKNIIPCFETAGETMDVYIACK
ncbi:MAG: helix-turn-helix transcriptional regulator [Treponema sp.]